MKNTEELVAKPPKKAQRQKPKPEVVRAIYARAAGRCLLCSKELTMSRELGEYAFNIGEMAHIVGQSLDKTSPRSDFELPKELRDEADNFLLLCSGCHSIIDAGATRKDFTVQWLRDWKRDREAHIAHVTGLPQSHRTCIVRLVGLIRGQAVQITTSECNSATLHHSTPRFAFFPLVYGRQEVGIDLTRLGEPEHNPQYWTSVQYQVQTALTQIRTGIERGELDHLSVFGFARIPVLAYFGFALGNKVATTLFQRRRTDDKPWHWLTAAEPRGFEWVCLQTGTDAQCVALVLNISGTIQLAELPTPIDERYYVVGIKPIGCDPQPDALLSEACLQAFRQCYRQVLAHLEAHYKLARAVHLFAAVPAGVALLLGADLLPDVQPEVILYDRQPREFSPALRLNSPR
ncbi:SAVED domain-containing protein [Hymenobacter sp. UV11]|uniref:SAVED domain-containing protein n=1 Tax=Hymenobacter sp. UV11 TaxID=1849735 RepID=UPI00105EA68B|nr:SAVED domain-containing protein [Hymenobacter sp. UV11]TDN37018.1 hypothetical protein A8B98_06395 [Hymenobacter sp. UV11]TFZ64221.1 SAVED domain-containing protein [Hymenobacter sp. UV11]